MLLRRLLDRQAALATTATAPPESIPATHKAAVQEQPWKLHMGSALLLAPDASKLKLTLTEL